MFAESVRPSPGHANRRRRCRHSREGGNPYGLDRKRMRVSAGAGRSMPVTEPVLQVAVPVPVRHLFDYLPPRPGWTPPVRSGVRVRVPFGRTSTIGVVVGVARASTVDARRLKRVRDVIDAEPLLDAATLKLLLWSSGYFQHPVGEVVVGTLPRLLRLGRAPKAERSLRYAATAAGASAFAEGIGGAPVQARLLDLMLDAGSVSEAELAAAHRDWRRPLRALIAKGWVEVAPDQARPGGAGRPATPDRPVRPAASDRPVRPAASVRRGRFAASRRPARLAGSGRSSRPPGPERRAATRGGGGGGAPRGIQPVRARRRHRQRQDGGVPAADRDRRRPRAPGARAHSGDRPHPAASRPVPRAARLSRGAASLRALRRRAALVVDACAQRHRGRGGGNALRGVRAPRAAGAVHRR